MLSKSAPGGQPFYYANLLLALATAAYFSGVLGSSGLRSAGSSTEDRAFEGLAKVVHKMTSDKQKAADQLFTRLKLHKTESNLFTSRKFDDWMDSVRESYKKTPKAADAAIFVTLRAQFGDDGLATILQSAKTDYVAKSLERVQFKYWMDEGKSADDVFKLLKLDDAARDPLKNPAVGAWMSYVEALKGNPHKLLLTKLEARYSDEGLARMLALAQRESASSDAYGVAWKLESTLREQWQHQGRSAEDVFSCSDWTSKETSCSRSSTTIVELRNELWLNQGKMTAQAYLLLQLDTLGEHVLFSPDLSPLVSYAKKVAGKVDEKSGVSEVVSLLAGQFGDEITLARKLSVVISLNMGTSRDSTVLYELQKLLFKRWFEKEVKPSDITGRLVTSFDKGYGVLNAYQRFYRTSMAKAGK